MFKVWNLTFALALPKQSRALAQQSSNPLRMLRRPLPSIWHVVSNRRLQLLKEHNDELECSLEGKEPIIFPLSVVDQPKDLHFNLFYYSTCLDNGERKSHYAYITDISKLLFDNTKRGHKCHICLKCLHNFSSEELLIEHNRDNLCTKKDGPVKCWFIYTKMDQ